MRQADVDELWAIAKIGPRRALELSVTHPLAESFTIIADSPVAMGGIVKTGSTTAEPWALGTDWITSHPIAFTRCAKNLLYDFASRFHLLHNYIDDRNVSAKCWLEMMGFTFRDPAPRGPFGLPFRYFFMLGEL